MINLAIICDNAQLRSKIEELLTSANYAIIKIYERDFSDTNLILCDLTHSKNIDLSFIADVKNHVPFIPLVVLVNQGDVQTTVQAMLAGAVNAIEIPFNQNSLIKGIEDGLSKSMDLQRDQLIIHQAIDLLQSLSSVSHSISGHISENTSQVKLVQIGDLEININQEKVFYQNTRVELTNTQFKLLAILAKNQKRVVTYEELYFQLHKKRLDRASARTALSAHLSYLRTKLDDVGCRDYVENIRGRGYILDIPELE